LQSSKLPEPRSSTCSEIVIDSNDDPEKASASIHIIALARSNDIDEKDQQL
jgi:hypothetical protein